MRPIWYWNQTNFEGLLAVAGEADRRGYSDLAEYYRLRERGLRKQALSALDRFIALVATWPEHQRRAFVEWLMALREQLPEVHHLLPNPLLSSVVVPILEAWKAESPKTSVPCRWLGVLTQDADVLREAIAADPGDDISRKHLVGLLLRSVDHATHHLVENHFIGPVTDALFSLKLIDEQLRFIRDPQVRETLQHSADSLRRLVDDWQEYLREQPLETFPVWCGLRGREHAWWSIVYYRP